MNFHSASSASACVRSTASMEARLARQGITTIAQLCAATRDQLHTLWGGVGGERYYDRLRGEWVPDLETNTSSVGHSHVLAPELRNEDDAFAILHRLTQKTAMRLRKMSYYASRLSIKMKYLNGPVWSREAQYMDTQDTVVFLRALAELWKMRPRRKTLKPLAVGVVLHGLVHETAHSGALFENETDRHKLYSTIDELNVKFGKNAVYFAGAHRAIAEAPMRIAFNHIPDLETEK
jgi:DNA polymerase IV